LFHKEHAAAHAGGLKRRGAARGSASQYREIEALFRHVQPTLLAWGFCARLHKAQEQVSGQGRKKRCFSRWLETQTKDGKAFRTARGGDH
jgi:hypothetical protein